MKCPCCNSKELVREMASGYAGYRCSNCGRWNYQQDVMANERLEPDKVYRCRHCKQIHNEYTEAFKCCNPSV